MIGVAVDPTEREIAEEFFELFKTPWEFCKEGGLYDVLLCTHGRIPEQTAGLVLVFNSTSTAFDAEHLIGMQSRRGGAMLAYEGSRIPIYGEVATFPSGGRLWLKDQLTQEPATITRRIANKTCIRVGYDLFREVRHLLTAGQTAVNAGTPTLELHIALLRGLITGSGIGMVEVPPVPDRHPFIVCLTHDIDHPVLRNHWCDPTMFGFLYRATLGTLIHVCHGRKSFRDLRVNWIAALRLPFVYLGLAEDFWAGFDRYLELEQGMGSTYFVIPRKSDPGRGADASAMAKRGARYDITDIEAQLKHVLASGREVGLHGIDAWQNSDKGREERDRVVQVLGPIGNGVRMHWLFFDGKSPAALDKAGFSYDSTVGYRETVGYRAGTTQAYKPLQAGSLFELPLHIMDTALFYPRYLDLSDADAQRTVWKLIDLTERYGGVLTFNWHDRSIAPERLWDGFYVKLLKELKGRGAWFPNGAQAVSWFKKRRSASIEHVAFENRTVRVKAVMGSGGENLPGLRIRIHSPALRRTESAAGFVDVAFNGDMDESIPLPATNGPIAVLTQGVEEV